MKVINSIMPIAIMALLWSCQESSKNGSTLKAPNSDYEYVVYGQGSGEKAKVGQYVYFEFDIFDDKDSLLQSYRNQEQMPSIKIPEAGSPALKATALIDVLSVSSVGDSLGIIMPRDSLKNLPPGYEHIDNFIYRMVVKEIVDEEEYRSRIEEQQKKAMAQAEALRARLPEIEELAGKTIKDYNRGRLKVETTESGLKYYIHEKGEGQLPVAGNTATMQYYGALAKDGTFFDSSFKNGRSFPLRVGANSVIKGWEEAIPLLPEGTKASLFIPSDLGYGEMGSPPRIPGGAELYFYVEVEDVKL